MQRADHWIRRIRSATTTAAVLELIASFLGSIPVSELEMLPREARADLGRLPRDLNGAALDLVLKDLRFDGAPAEARVLHEVADTVAAASGRLAELANPRRLA